MKSEKEINDKIFEIKSNLTDTWMTEYSTLSSSVIIEYLINRALNYRLLQALEWVLED